MIEKTKLHPDDQLNWPGWVSYICGKWEIIRRYKPKVILEIGVRTGYAAWAFLQAHPKSLYIGLDDYSYGPYPDWAKKNLLQNYNYQIYKIDTQKLTTFQYITHKADFIHVDGDHTTQGVMHDLDLALTVLNSDGVILVDDYDRISEVRTGVDAWLQKHPKLDWKYCESFTGDILIGAVVKSLEQVSTLQVQQNISKSANESAPVREGQLLIFHHGLGDLLLFLPLYDYLQRKGKYKLVLQTGCGFLPLVSDGIETPPGDFNYAALCQEYGYKDYKIIKFSMSEGSGRTKTQLCAETEFSLNNYEFDDLYKHTRASKLVGVNFHGTCLPDLTNPDYETAKEIWNEIKEVGYTPIEVYFEHSFHNAINKKFDFVDNSTRGMKVNIDTLAGIMSGCYAFIGVLSGVWVMAMGIVKTRNIMALEKHYHAHDYYAGKLNIANIYNYTDDSVKNWLNTLDKDASIKESL